MALVLACSSLCMEGSATFTMKKSSTIMNVPAISTARAAQRLFARVVRWERTAGIEVEAMPIGSGLPRRESQAFSLCGYGIERGWLRADQHRHLFAGGPACGADRDRGAHPECGQAAAAAGGSGGAEWSAPAAGGHRGVVRARESGRAADYRGVEFAAAAHARAGVARHAAG